MLANPKILEQSRISTRVPEIWQIEVRRVDISLELILEIFEVLFRSEFREYLQAILNALHKLSLFSVW
jgi:hypothetical protein